MSDGQSLDDLLALDDDAFKDITEQLTEDLGEDQQEEVQETNDEEYEEEEESNETEEEPEEVDTDFTVDDEETINEPEDTGGVEEEEEPVEGLSGYEAIGKDLLKPFKANGKEMSVTTVDEARHLMQKGANYDKKMAAIKPNLRLIRMLDNNGLLDEDKLSYLIDLDKKNPEAIAKLVKEAEIDPLDIDVSEEAKYQPNTYTVNDKEVEFEEVLDEIRGTSSYARTIDIVSNKWDDSSKQAITASPNTLKAINEHISNGTFDEVMAKVDTERMFGRLDGLSDLEAYKAAGDILYAKAENHDSAKANERLNQKPNKKSDPKLANRKLAASGSRRKPQSNKVMNESKLLEMTDEEIMNFKGF